MAGDIVNTYNNRVGSLLASTTRVEAPFVRVNIGGYTFGVYENSHHGTNQNGVYRETGIKYPNYIKSLQIKKINGTVNQYTLVIDFPISYGTDPNFFEKIFSAISDTRTINIDYGDFMLPEYIYRDEEAIITDVGTSFDVSGSKITYTIEAVSTAKLTLSGSYNFISFTGKPSDRIKRILKDQQYNLMSVYTGMKNADLDKFIMGDDKPVTVPTCVGLSPLDYIAVLVSYMQPIGTPTNTVKTSGVYALTTFEDTTGVYGGPYFKVEKIHSSVVTLNKLCTYTIDIGYPTANVVTAFNVKNSSNWSILYNYKMALQESSYTKTIDDKGNVQLQYSPMLTGSKYYLNDSEKQWWTKVTEFPIQASITFRGLLRPAILMTYVKLNVWYSGIKHNVSGYYIITGHTDNISENGFETTLELVRVAGDEEFVLPTGDLVYDN